MNNVEKMFAAAKDFPQFASEYIEYLCGLLRRLDTGALARLLAELEEAKNGGNTVFVIGNGGSAATASHIANDWGIGVNSEPGSAPLRVHSLTDNVAAISAVANDASYEQIFVSQLRLHYRPGDKLIAVSASGNSPNILAAARWVRAQGGAVIGLIGFDGGGLRELCHVAVHVKTPKGEYGPVEDAHMVLDHLLYSWLRLKERQKTTHGVR